MEANGNAARLSTGAFQGAEVHTFKETRQPLRPFIPSRPYVNKEKVLPRAGIIVMYSSGK